MNPPEDIKNRKDTRYPMAIQELPNYDLQELTDSIMAFVDESQDEMIHFIRVFKLLLDGSPISPKRIADELQVSEDVIGTLLQVAELDKDGNVVGLGLSLVPTPHSYRIDERQFYAWCAADAIHLPILLESENNAVIESADPISGDIIRMIATPEGPKDVEPATAVVSHPTAIESFLTVRSNACNSTNFFASVETASQYVSQQPRLMILPIDDVFELWRRVWSAKKSLIHMQSRSGR